MADLIYANGKLWDAVGILATHPGRIHDRLIVACRASLVFVPEHVLPSYLEPIYQRGLAEGGVVKRVQQGRHLCAIDHRSYR